MKRSEKTIQRSPEINGADMVIDRIIRRRYSDDGDKAEYKSVTSRNARLEKGMTFKSPKKAMDE